MINPNDFADVMVLNDIIEQAAGRHSRASDHGGETFSHFLPSILCSFYCFNDFTIFYIYNRKEEKFCSFLLLPPEIIFNDDDSMKKKEMPKTCICCKLNLICSNSKSSTTDTTCR
jgi:hypothetical protein